MGKEELEGIRRERKYVEEITEVISVITAL